MLLDDYYWHYDYARLAWDTGFCFDKYKYPNLDKNKICLIDIDRIVKERDVASVERNIATVVQYVLENDQAEVLDSNFVKLFRLSQLSVEYLLFCKKYLDKTVVLLKKDIIKLKQEIKESREYTEELESHISSSRNLTARYNCEICSKMFSTEEYLNSHVKRRHSSTENKDSAVPATSEAEKLHSEIKELKERLNNTEKFIQEKPSNREVDNFKEVNEETEGKSAKLVSEIQESFEKFRKQVEEKMTSLQSEKNFFTDKYDKLFEIVLQYKSKEPEQSTNQELRVVEEKKMIETPRIENISTQTEETKKVKELQIHTIQHDNTYHFQDRDDEIVSGKEVEDINEKIDKKLSNLEENIDSKISSGLCNIENQIQAFWQKLSEGDLPQPHPVPEAIQIVDTPVQTELPDDFSNQNQVKPKIKPRTKLTKPTATIFKGTDENTDRAAAKIKNELDEILSRPNKTASQSATVIKSAVSNMYETSSEANSESDERSSVEENALVEEDKSDGNISYSPVSVKDHQTKSNVLPVKAEGKSLIVVDTNISSLSKKKSKTATEKDDITLSQELRQQLSDAVDSSLQEMGISPSWKGIPKKTFERALEIVTHQAVLNKKGLPEYDSIKKSIEKMLKNNKGLKEVTRKVQSTGVAGISPSRKQSKPKTIKIQIKKNELPSSKSLPVVKIKNRSLYDTESETDINSYLPKNFSQEKKSETNINPYSPREKKSDQGKAQNRPEIDIDKFLPKDLNQEGKSDQEKARTAVIEELQSKFSQKSADTDSDLNSNILSFDEKDKKEKETKSAMKTYPSEGSLVKKKVFFDVEDFDAEDYDNEVETQPEQKAKSKDDSLSDFEIT